MASVDPVEGEKGNKAFAESEKADFPLLGDPTKETAAAYGVLHPERGFAQRWTFYIDKDGKIAAIDKAVKPADLGRGHDRQARRAEGREGALSATARRRVETGLGIEPSSPRRQPGLDGFAARGERQLPKPVDRR